MLFQKVDFELVLIFPGRKGNIAGRLENTFSPQQGTQSGTRCFSKEKTSADRLHELARLSQQGRQGRSRDAHSPAYDGRMILDLS